jgi:hypothetical protein
VPSYHTRAAAALLPALLLLPIACNNPPATPAAGAHQTVTMSPRRAESALSDAEFAKNILTKMTNADTSVVDEIDWDRFKANGLDVGKAYAPFKNTAGGASFRTSFITSFSSSFKKSGGSMDKLTNWKVDHGDANSVTISALSTANKHILLTLSKDGGSRLLIGLQPGP